MPDLLDPEPAELAVLHAAFTEPQWTRVLNLRPSDFYDPAKGALWQALGELDAKGIRPDPGTVSQHLHLAKHQRQRMADLMVAVVTDPSVAANAEAHALTVTDRATRRALLAATDGARQRLNDLTQPVDAAVAYVEQALVGSASGQDREADQLWTYNEFVSQDLPPVEWVIPDLLAREDRLVLTGTEGAGKALALDTPIPTPSGWTTMGELAAGDMVLTPSGEAAPVAFTTGVMTGHDCYRVRFSDGSEIVADAEHLWETETLAARESRVKYAKKPEGLRLRGTDQKHKRVHFPQVVTTDQIRDTLRARNGHCWNHSIAATEPLQLPAADLLVDPYVLGAWLGDGHTADARITCHPDDGEILDRIRQHYPVHATTAPLTWAINDGIRAGRRAKPEALRMHLRALGVLGFKHIPDSYLRASFEQRLALIQGLMDTDGSVGPNGMCEFSVCSERLASDVQELLHTLGIKVVMRSGPAKLYGREVNTRWRLGFQTDLPVFHLQRKAERLAPLRTRRAKLRYIVAVDPVESVPVRCIQVDHPSRMYLAGRTMIPTHNTTLQRTIAVMAASGLHPFTLQAMEPRRVLFVDLENPNRIMVKRFQEIGEIAERRGHHPHLLNIRRIPQGMDLSRPDHRMRLRYLCQATQPELLVIGPAYKMVRTHAGEGFEESVAHIAEALDDLREEYRFALLLEHHIPKGEPGRDRGVAPIGSSFWLRWPEFGIGLKLDPTSTFHDRRAELVHWRGARDDRPWPKHLESGGPGSLPWIDRQSLAA